MRPNIDDNHHANGRTVVVTGGAGYIGSLVVRQLLERGDHVRIVDSLVYGDSAIRDLAGNHAVELMKGDFRDTRTLTSAFAGASAVIHLGAIVGDHACALDEDRAISTNVVATELIAEQCGLFGIERLVFASTCSVYGASIEPLDEDSDLRPVSLYANTKIAAEKVLLENRFAGAAPVILRFGTAYGLSPRVRFDLVVNLLAAKAVQDGRITVHGGDQWRPFIHVHDIARAVILALDADPKLVAGEIINVGVDDQNLQISRIGEIIRQLVPTAEILTDTRVIDQRNYFVHFAKARRLLGFSLTRTVEDGVREFVELLRNGSVDDYRHPVYHNALSLQEDGRHDASNS